MSVGIGGITGARERIQVQEVYDTDAEPEMRAYI